MTFIQRLPLLLLTAWLLLLVYPSAEAEEGALAAETLSLLASDNFADKAQAVERLAERGDALAKRLLGHMAEGELVMKKGESRLLIGILAGRDYQVSDALTGEALGTLSRREVDKVKVNNALRGKIASVLAAMDLKHPDSAVRLAAVEQLIERPDAEAIARLPQLMEAEQEAEVREMMAVAIAIDILNNGEGDARLAAAKSLDGNVHPKARAALLQLQEKVDDPALKKAIATSLKHIEDKLDFYALIENLFFGLSLGSVLVLASIGLAITFGVMGVINMAHGELIMIGAYTTYVIQQLMPESIGLSIIISIPAAFIVAALVGIAIERGVIRFLYGRPLETLLATFGISLILQQAVRSIFSPLNRSVATPEWMSGVWQINSALGLTFNRLYIIVFCLLVFAALFMVLKKTALGLQVRAVSQNRAMARAMGVRSEWVDAMTFGLGSGIAGVAGVALSQLTNVGPNLGQAYIIDSFMVVVFGGVGNLWGTLVSGMTLGVANKFLEPWAGAVLAKILVLVFIILFIQKKPRGLFPQKGRAADG